MSYEEGYQRGQILMSVIQRKLSRQGQRTSDILRRMADVLDDLDSADNYEERLQELEKEWSED